jgi:hypothetical protein
MLSGNCGVPALKMEPLAIDLLNGKVYSSLSSEKVH